MSNLYLERLGDIISLRLERLLIQAEGTMKKREEIREENAAKNELEREFYRRIPTLDENIRLLGKKATKESFPEEAV
ncbi:MAG: hypothetical protein Q8O55_09645 [Dehalococcoidales bacterium]|nr:hypothetical protein [Dehalococcoidales bacterium]